MWGHDAEGSIGRVIVSQHRVLLSKTFSQNFPKLFLASREHSGTVMVERQRLCNDIICSDVLWKS